MSESRWQLAYKRKVAFRFGDHTNRDQARLSRNNDFRFDHSKAMDASVSLQQVQEYDRDTVVHIALYGWHIWGSDRTRVQVSCQDTRYLFSWDEQIHEDQFAHFYICTHPVN